MCLEKLQDFEIKLNNNGEAWAWKTFVEIDGELKGEIVNYPQTRPRDEWLNEKDYRDEQREQLHTLSQFGHSKLYPIGWHVFKTKQGAKHWGGDIGRVKIRNIVATGIVDDYQVIVAKEMFIPEEEVFISTDEDSQ